VENDVHAVGQVVFFKGNLGLLGLYQRGDSQKNREEERFFHGCNGFIACALAEGGRLRFVTKGPRI
jgi:hypothetical protein